MKGELKGLFLLVTHPICSLRLLGINFEEIRYIEEKKLLKEVNKNEKSN